MTSLTFPIGAMMQWSDNKITDHNRAELSVSVERIGTPKRMANGTMRNYVVADKRTFSTSWRDLPNATADTVDGFWGGQEIENFYNTHAGAFPLKVTYGDNTSETFSVMISKFSKVISRRSSTHDLWNVDVELTEV
jgi:hypothetical protein